MKTEIKLKLKIKDVEIELTHAETQELQRMLTGIRSLTLIQSIISDFRCHATLS